MDNNKELKGQVVSGLIWKFAERIIVQVISFVISLILARLLAPEQYGVISLVMVFITIANVFVSDGLGAGLIQSKDAGDTEFSTMFFCSLIFSLGLYGVLFFSAPLIAAFYSEVELVLIVRVLGLQIPLSAIKTIQHSYVSKYMMFRKFFFSTLGGTIVSGIIGIYMAYRGFGVWALVEQYLVNSVIDIIVLLFTIKWRPHLKFSIQSAKKMLGYSSKLLLAQLINTIYVESRNLIIGKIYTPADLAYNSKGSQYPSLLITNINTSISSVLFPAMSKANGDIDSLKNMTRRSMKLTSYIIFPLMVGLMVVAKPLIRILMTEKWIGCVPFLRIACIYWMVQPCQTANIQALKASGRSDICLKLEVIKKVIGFSLIILTMRISVYALAISNAAFAVISAIINIFPNRKIIRYGFREQIMDLVPAFFASIVMGGCVYFLTFLTLPDVYLLFLQIVVGAGMYLLISYLAKIDSFEYILMTIKQVLMRKRRG